MTREEIQKKTSDLYNKTMVFVQSVLRPRGIESDQVMFVGSLALALHDMPVEDVHDIDLEIYCKKEQEEVFKILADLNENDFYKQKEDSYMNATWENKPYIFEWKGVKFNVWCVREWSHKDGLRLGNSMIVAGVSSVLERKLKYKRKKDFEYVGYLIKKLSSFITKN